MPATLKSGADSYSQTIIRIHYRKNGKWYAVETGESYNRYFTLRKNGLLIQASIHGKNLMQRHHLTLG